jgi:hypothetical protein
LIFDFFKELENVEYFNKVKFRKNVLYWPNGQDIAPDTVYLDKVKINDFELIQG